MCRQPDVWNKGIAICLLAIIFGFYAFVIYLGPEFQALFREFDSDLPISTRIVLGIYFYWSILFIALGAVGFTMILMRRDSRGWAFLVPALISIVVFLPVAVWAMYAPIIVLGNTT